MRGLRILSLLCLALVPLGANAQEDTLGQLRAEISALSSVVAELAQGLSAGSVVPPAGLEGSVIDQLERLRGDLASLTARTEALEFRIRRVVDDASNRIGDMEFRLTELEGGDPAALPSTRPLGEAPGQTAVQDSPAQPDAATPAPMLAAGEQMAFDAARDLLADGRLDEGVAAMSAFLETYPGSPLTAQASRLLADAQRSIGAEADAARTWLNLYMANPDGRDAPLALLELGQSLDKLDQRSEACVMFEELLTRFPDSPEALEGRGIAQTLGCL